MESIMISLNRMDEQYSKRYENSDEMTSDDVSNDVVQKYRFLSQCTQYVHVPVNINIITCASERSGNDQEILTLHVRYIDRCDFEGFISYDSRLKMKLPD